MKILCLLSSVLFATSAAWAASPETVRRNDEAIQKYKSENYYEAYRLFTESLAQDPLNVFLHENLALTFLKNEEKDKALSSFRDALNLAKASSDPQALYLAHFNLATYLASEGKVDEALTHFQSALEVIPQDPLVRENIEKMWQSQQGQGKGGNPQDQQSQQNQQQDQNGQGEQNQPQDNPSEGEKPEQKQNKPKPFDSQDLSQDDVRKILEELKNQEQKIRANVYEGQGKEKPRDKDW